MTVSFGATHNSVSILDDIKSSFNGYTNVEFGQLALEAEADILSWLKSHHNPEESVCIFVGQENQTFFNMTIAVKGMVLTHLINKVK